MLHIGQVTIPASGKVALSTQRTPCFEVTVQKNSANGIRVGDSTVTATTGIAVAASNAVPGPFTMRPSGGGLLLDLSTIYVFGTAGDLVDFSYIK